MSLAGILLTLACVLVTIVGLLRYGLKIIGRLIGNALQARTQNRRDILINKAKAEEQEQDVGKGLQSGTGLKEARNSSSSLLDAEWEKVHYVGDQKPTEHKDSVLTRPSIVADESFDGIIGFFHPFCNAGGGGERVLFAAIMATQQRYPNALCVVYTGDHDASRDQILANVRHRFNIHLKQSRVVFLYLTTREWVLASRWPYFTLLGQSIGSLLLGWEALNILPPDVFVDTMGYAFVLALCKWLLPRVPTGAYVHYPTISTDMLESLHTDESKGVNAGQGRGLRGIVKQYYWRLFARVYSWIGGGIDIVMTNSSWTHAHITSLWAKARGKRGMKFPIEVMYPPCAVAELQEKIPVDGQSETQRTGNLLYIAQFRPEKMHHIIIEAFHKYLRSYHANTKVEDRPRLVLVGSVRDDHDEKRVYKLRIQAQEVKDSIDFVVNAKWPQILDFLRSSSVGVNGMWNEHFGIGVVEYQAAGLISVVNDSGGPKEDIVVNVNGQPTGFHASTPEQFAEAFNDALSLSREDTFAMRLRARKSSQRFSEEVFETAWTRQLDRLVDISQQRSSRQHK